MTRSVRLALVVGYLSGLVLKVLHLPYHTIWLLVFAGAGIALSLSELRRSNGSDTRAQIASWCWALHLISVLKLFPFAAYTLGIAFATTLWAAMGYWNTREFSRSLRTLSGVFILVMLIMARPRSERFYATNLAFSLERGTDAASWDKYSFLLFHDDDATGAIEANEQAVQAARISGRPALIPLLYERSKAISSGEWPTYYPLSDATTH